MSQVFKVWISECPSFLVKHNGNPNLGVRYLKKIVRCKIYAEILKWIPLIQFRSVERVACPLSNFGDEAWIGEHCLMCVRWSPLTQSNELNVAIITSFTDTRYLIVFIVIIIAIWTTNGMSTESSGTTIRHNTLIQIWLKKIRRHAQTKHNTQLHKQ
jgi:hypothetical protein